MWGYFDGENNKNDSIPVESISPLVFFFTCYVMFSDIVGITKLYQMYKIYDTFISFFSEIAFLCFLRI